MPKNILPPKTKTFLSASSSDVLQSAMKTVRDNTMVGAAVEEYLTNLGVDRNVPRPPAFFSDDDKWRAVVKALAFNVRHTREAVRRVMELVLAPRKSVATILNRKNNRAIQAGDTLQILSGANVGTYTVEGITPYELMFSAGTFGTIPEVGPISYRVGTGSPPATGPTEGTQGRLYVAPDGTERFTDSSQEFLNLQRTDILTRPNSFFPEFAQTLVLDKNAPNEEEVTLAYYDKEDSGLGKIKGDTLLYTHRKYVAFRGSTLSSAAAIGNLTLTVESGTNFPTNAAAVQLVQVGDNLTILEGPNAGTYAITGVSKNRVTVGAVLTVTGPGANNRFKIAPVAVPAGSKGTIFNRGHVANTSGGSSTFICPDFDFSQEVDTDRFAVVINRGEFTEEVIEVIERNANTLTLVVDPNDSSKSLLKFPHALGETVEVFGLPESTTGTYFTSGTASGGTTTQLIDATSPFAAHLVGSDIEFITAALFGVPRYRTISNFVGINAVDFTPTIPPPPAVALSVSAGDTYRIIKRYKATVDSTLYVEDASGFPASDFTIILDRGKENEEVVYISTNTAPATAGDPWELALSNPATVANDHEQDMTVELAQVLIEGCDWEIIETRATGEYTIYVPKGCLPELTAQGATYLHTLISSKVAGTNAALVAPAPNAGEEYITINLTGAANSYEDDIEETTEPPGVVMRAVVIDKSGNNEEFAFLTKQRRTAIVAVDYFANPTQTYLEVEDASSFVGLAVGYNLQVSRRSTNPSSVVEVLTFNSVDLTKTPHRINTVGIINQPHMAGDMIEIDPVEVSVASPLLLSHLVGEQVELLYIVEDTGVPRYKHPDPDNPSVYTDLVNASWREAPPNESYYADSAGQDSSDGAPGKPIFPGSFIFSLISDEGNAQNFASSYITRLSSTFDPSNTDAMYKIPYQQTIQGTDLVAGAATFIVADGRLYPDNPQNPWYVILDRGAPNEERLEITGRVPSALLDFPDAFTFSIDPTTPVLFDHPIGSTVDLEVSKVFVMSPAGMPDEGGIYFDYGFRGNEVHIEDLILSGTHTSGTAYSTIVVDSNAQFQQYGNPEALKEATIVIRPGTATEETKLINFVANDNSLTLKFPALTIPIAFGDAYKIYATGIEVDDSEPGTSAQHVGGVITNINSGQQQHPEREGGVVEEYVRYSSRDGAVLTLAQPTVFKYAHPSASVIVVGSGNFNTKGDSSDYPAYLTGNYLEILFNETITNFASLIKAAGIEAKVEEKDA